MEEKHFIREGPKLKYADIKKVEAEIGRDIPTDYIDFLMLHNGGHPEHCNFLDPETDRLDSAELFYGLGETFDLGVQRIRIPYAERAYAHCIFRRTSDLHLYRGRKFRKNIFMGQRGRNAGGGTALLSKYLFIGRFPDSFFKRAKGINV
ncbi:hypothetical protein bsdcttw_21370 [Anaerocolumna chitinilytica]|uniref:Knr4/Smi1-like domain-containing protein n=1 Tax=Anaerocolumna chitinilytica TaxID=1727145 RepID=A0A7I8DS42_9FIRM|nr:hypothetical protein bsdcttw_21370 [Anaerocolumna chitinilytica]